MVKNENSVNISLSILIFLIGYVIPQPFLPTLIYDYNTDPMGVQIWNVGLKPATDVLIEIIPRDGVSIYGIMPSEVNGELITNYSKNNTSIFHLYHIYNQDHLIFTLTSDQKINRDDVKIFIRSNEGSGIEATSYYQDLLKNLQIILIIVALIFGITIYLFTSGMLKKIIERRG